MGTHPVRLAAWQEQVIAKVNFVECERVRLWPSDRKDDDHIHAATDMRLNAACRAAGVLRNGEPLPRRSRIVRLANWPGNAWTGAPIKSAFAHLHAAVVELVDLYTEDDIKARSPRVSSPGCKPVSPPPTYAAKRLRGSSVQRPTTSTPYDQSTSTWRTEQGAAEDARMLEPR